MSTSRRQQQQQQVNDEVNVTPHRNSSPVPSSIEQPTSAQRPKPDTEQAKAGPGPRTRSNRAAAVKARLATAEQARIENRPESKRKRADSDSDAEDAIEDESEGEDDDGKNGILVDPINKDKKWLKVDEDFPWDQVEWYLDESIDETMRTHLGKRIERMEGSQCLDDQEADMLLINPHPKKFTQERSKNLTDNINVKEGCTLILPYNWLSKCYFTKKVQQVDSRNPLFLDEDGNSLKVIVMKLGEGPEGEKQRKELMVDLESNGAMVISAFQQAQICISLSSHPYYKNPPKGEQYKHIKWHTPEWVQEQIKSYEKENEVLPKPMQPKSNTQSGPSLKLSKKVKAESDKKQDKLFGGQSKLKGERIEHVPYSRTLFTASDRDFLARWLAYKRPTKVGRTTRSLYKQLGAYEPSHPFFRHAIRHPPSAWHEHFKKSRSKLGVDGKVLEEEVNRYVEEDIDRRLKTKDERGGRDRQSPVKSKVESKGKAKGKIDEIQDGKQKQHEGQKEVKQKKKQKGKAKKTDKVVSGADTGEENHKVNEEKNNGDAETKQNDGNDEEKDNDEDEPVSRTTRSRTRKQKQPNFKGESEKTPANVEKEVEHEDRSLSDTSDDGEDQDRYSEELTGGEVDQADVASETRENGQGSDVEHQIEEPQAESIDLGNSEQIEADDNMQDTPQEQRDSNSNTQDAHSGEVSVTNAIEDSEAVEQAIGIDVEQSFDANHTSMRDQKDEPHIDNTSIEGRMQNKKVTFVEHEAEDEDHGDDDEEWKGIRKSKRARR